MKKLLNSLVILLLSSGVPAWADAVVVFNEIMYHPATNEAQMEWIELRNQMGVDVDISDWSVGGTIEFTFASNTVIRAGGHLLLALSPDTLKAMIGDTNVLGPFTGRLGNNGGTLELRDNSGRPRDILVYGTDEEWPVAPDGSGVSLAKRDPDTASEPPGNWTSSAQFGGTPGAVNFPVATGFVAPPGLVSLWSFNEPSGPNISDRTGRNPGALGSGGTRSAGGVGGALTFGDASNAFVNVGPGSSGSFSVTNGVTIEAVLQPGWNSTNSAVIFRKAIRQPGSYLTTVMGDVPIAYWRLSDASTTIADSSPNGHNGTATAGVQLGQPGIVPSESGDGAVRATGANRIIIPGFEKIGTTGYTVEFWVKVHALPTACCQNLVGDGEAAGDFFMMNYILGPGQGLVGAIRPHFGPANVPVSIDSPTALQVNGTYHIVTTWDTTRSANNAAIYINGVPDRIGTVSTIRPSPGTTGANPVYIGLDNRDVPNGDYTYDEVALYDHPLSASNVTAHYVAGVVANFEQNQGNAVQLAFQDDGNNSAANPPVAAGPVLSFGLTVNGTYSELDMPLDGQDGRPTLAELKNGQPHHVAALYNSATGLKAIYVDGVLRFSTTLSGGLNTDNVGDAILGNSEVDGTQPFNGALDEMAFWSRALSAADVAGHWAAIQAGNDYFETPEGGSVTTLAFNELSATTNSTFWLELINYGVAPISLQGFAIRRDGAGDEQYIFPAGPALAAGGRVAVTNTTLGYLPLDGDKLLLLPPAQDRVIDAVVLKRLARARSPEGTGPWLRPDQASPGAANSFAFRTEIVINEIMYHQKVLPGVNGQPPRESPEQWLELYNRSSNAVDLAGWELQGGITYQFLPGTTLGAGAYLVVAEDPVSLRAAYPGIDIVGGFAGRLSGKGERLVLFDPSANPADEVRYYDSGRWPENADGGGSSLELREPEADNSQAEAWTASDESEKASWFTVSYRKVAGIPPGSGQPTTWADTIFGLLGPGECLIDDISVIETPAGTPRQLIANGDFENGRTGWRFLGTHGQSDVIPEPGNAGNHVLHVVATGAEEHMHNHIETTHIGQRLPQNGSEYEISYRARWISGNNRLNSRLYFNRCARTTPLPYPALTGTPGAPNSRRETNIGPTFTGFGHFPVTPLPGDPVAVRVTPADPQGVSACTLFWSINSGEWSSAAMTNAGGDHYVGSVPGQAAGAIAQFYVRATDGFDATADFPAAGPESGALFKVSDGQANLNLGHNVRIILTPDNANLLHALTNVMSNADIPGTVVIDEKRAHYNMGVRLKGSQRGRYSDIRTSFHLEFPADDKFRGVHPFMLVDRSGAGDSTANKQEEIVIRHMIQRAGGIAGVQAEIARVLAPRPVHNGPSILLPRFEDEYVETAFENGGDGTMWELELIYFPLSTNSFGYKLPQPDNVVGTDITDLGLDPEIYRYNFIIKNHRDTDNYTPFITMARSWNLTGSALQQLAPESIDVDNWMRAWAIFTLCAVGDTYTFGNNHNLLMYERPSDGRIVPFLWDMDFSFNRGTTAALVGDQNFSKIVRLTPSLRSFYGHILDVIDITFNQEYMTYWLAHYTALCPGEDFRPRGAFIRDRATYARNTINSAGGNSPFVVNGEDSVTTDGDTITLTGTAPVSAKTITVNGRAYPITWTSLSAWSIRVPLNEGTNALVVQGWDLRGQEIPGFNRSLTAVSNAQRPDPAGQVVINEIMYNPVAPDGAFVELLNASATSSFDLSGWRFNGVDYEFPAGTLLTNGQVLVLAADVPAYAAAYNTNTPAAFDRFVGNLQNDGETLTLFRPGANETEEIEVDKVRYESVPAWPAAPNGFGPSLQLIDASRDNSRVANWSDGAGWRFFTFTGIGGVNATNFVLFLQSAGELIVDDFRLVAGTVPGEGENLISNGGFESGTLEPWVVSGTHAGTAVTTDFSHEGTSSMRILATGPGGATASIQHGIPTLTPTNLYTMSFWFLPSTNGTGINFRASSTFRTLVAFNYRPITSTPGAPNSTAFPLPAFPDVWLNEVQPENLTGISDSQGEREPFIELYNSGSTPVSLAGCYLADNYSNLTQWPFPPGATLAPGEFKVVFADGESGESTADEWHTGFRIVPSDGSIALAWSPDGAVQVLDYLNYNLISPDRSYGAFPDGQPFYRQPFYWVTPGETNNGTPAPIVVFINEWMALNTSTIQNNRNAGRYNDWIELYNPGTNRASLDGYFLTDNLSNRFQFAIPSGFSIPAGGFLLVWADNQSDLNDTNLAELHVDFALSQDGEAIGLFAPDGTAIDSVRFGTHYADISEGRFPDGTGPAFYLSAPTPGAPNAAGSNRTPTLAAIADTTLFVGESLNFTAVATDPELPPQVLTFFLAPGAPAGASITANGQFSWTPTLEQAGSTNSITVSVRDNGSPVLTASRTFRVVVLEGIGVSGIERLANGDIALTLATTAGRSYQVEYKNSLTDLAWIPLGPSFQAAGSSVTVTDDMGDQPQRFYHLVELP